MDKFWMIWNPNGTAPTYKHGSIDAAVTEAERLARLAPGQIFIILEALRACRVEEPPVAWTELEDDILRT